MPVTGPRVRNPATAVSGGVIARRRFLKRGADADHVAQSTVAGGPVVGVSLDAADAAERPIAFAHQPGEYVEVEAGGAIAIDTKVTPDVNGRAAAAANGNALAGITRQAAAALGDIILVELYPMGLNQVAGQ